MNKVHDLKIKETGTANKYMKNYSTVIHSSVYQGIK